MKNKKQKPFYRQNIIDIIQMAGDFENKFCDYDYIEPKDVLSELDFTQSHFYELDYILQKTLQENADVRWYGHPLSFAGQISNESVIMQNSEGDTVYFFREHRAPNGRTDYSCSRLIDVKNAYHINPIGYGCDVAELIHHVAFFEIIDKLNKNSCHHSNTEVIKIPCAEEVKDLITI